MRKQLTDLRALMACEKIDAYLIPTTDFHGSEYVNDYFKCRKFVSGFTGSAGTLVVTQEQAFLWTDGRYFLQAESQLKGSSIGLMKMGETGVPSVEEYLESVLTQDCTLGFDGRVIDCAMGRRLDKICKIRWDVDLVGEIWTERPEIQPSPIREIPLSVTGETKVSKLARLRAAMKSHSADYHLITKLEDIAWLFNLRGNDVENTPVFFAFALITPDRAFLYVMDQAFKGEDVRPYDKIFDDISRLSPGAILLDEETVSFSLVSTLPSHVRIINKKNPSELMKALKNQTEIDSTKAAHLKDGIAMVNFIYWLKTNIGRQVITEISAADYLEGCRRAQPGFSDLSFGTIAGYMSNGAIIHYDPIPETNKTLKAEGFLLVDSGGQYEDGTTDITRTIVLGPVSREMQEHYTAVLRCHISLAMAKFKVGTTGAQLDQLARRPLQELGLNYNHGTGHGVGHLLSVHEGPQSISPRGTDCPIYAGMITSNEPGVYLPEKYGIRLENEILAKEQDGVLHFETITHCPFDRDAILPEMLTADELAWLNSYHARVCTLLAPGLSEHTAAWLKEATAKIG